MAFTITDLEATHAAEGADAPSRTIQVGGKDSSGDIRPVRQATDGTVRVDPTGTTAQPATIAAAERALTAYHKATVWASESATQTLLSNVGGQSLILRSIICASTGNGRFEVKIGVAASEVTTHVVYTSEAHPTIEVNFFERAVPNGQQVIVVKTGQDRINKPLDYHTTISHHFSA